MRSLGYDFTAEASAMAGDEQVSAVDLSLPTEFVFICANVATWCVWHDLASFHQLSCVLLSYPDLLSVAMCQDRPLDARGPRTMACCAHPRCHTRVHCAGGFQEGASGNAPRQEPWWLAVGPRPGGEQPLEAPAVAAGERASPMTAAPDTAGSSGSHDVLASKHGLATDK